MKKLILIFLFSVVSHADQQGPMTCIGKYITLVTRSPYMGDDSPYSQKLFTLQSRASKDLKAYFLNVDEDVPSKTTGGIDGGIQFSGQNEVGGTFEMRTGKWTTKSKDGISMTSKATAIITYDHGPLKGKDEPVNCTIEN